MRVLLVEDSADLAANIWEYLEARSWVMDAAGDGIRALRLATDNRYDVIVLDLMLPGMDGLTVCRRLRAHAGGSTPVLMLTARDTLEDKLKGFSSGADDYLVKPFALAELDARMRVLVSRSRGRREQERLEVGDLQFDTAALRVTRAGRAITLTPIGRILLEVLMREAPRVVHRRELEHAVWQDDAPESDALRAHIHVLRSAIDKPFDVGLLHTVHGVGYRMAPPDAL